MNTRIKNFIIGLAFFTLQFGFSMALFEWVSPTEDYYMSLFMSGTLATIFGFIMWCALTKPEKLPRNDGWRKWRPLIWFGAFYAAFGSIPVFYGGSFDWSAGFAAVFVVGCGVMFLDLRRQRFEHDTRWSEEKAKPIGQKLAERAADIRSQKEQLSEEASNHYAPMIDDRIAAQDYEGAMEIANQLGKIDAVTYAYAMDRIRMARGDYEPNGKTTT